MDVKPLKILMIEDNPGDVRLVSEFLKDSKMLLNISVAEDGDKATEMLFNCTEQDRPDIILLDLNLPKKNGRDVLKEIKADETLKKIPVIILTSSSSDEDIIKTYNLHANAYLVKPLNLDEFLDAMKKFEQFWLTLVKYPNRQTE